jgi:hypothetical protein
MRWRPRFSMRLLMIFAVVVAVLAYILFVRPTAVAEHFAISVAQRNYSTAASFLGDQGFWAFYKQSISPGTTIDSVDVEVLPRQWSDVWLFRRRLLLHVCVRDDSDEQHVVWTETTNAIAYINGVSTRLGR